MSPNNEFDQHNNTSTSTADVAQVINTEPAVEEATDRKPVKAQRIKDNSNKLAAAILALILIVAGIIYSFSNGLIQLPSSGASPSIQSSKTPSTAAASYDGVSAPASSSSSSQPKISFEDWIRILVASVIATAIFSILTTIMAISMNAKMSAMVEITKEIRDSSDNITP